MSDPPTGAPVDLESLAARLLGYAPFRHYPPEHLRLLAEAVSAVELKAGETLFPEGSEGDWFGVVAHGILEANRDTPMGPQPMAWLEVGDLVGELSLIDGGGRSGTVTARTDAGLLRFDPDVVLRHAGEDRGFALSVVRSFWLSLTGKVRQAGGFMTRLLETRPSYAQPASRPTAERLQLTPERKEAALRLQGLEIAHLEELAATFRVERFPSRAYLFAEGDRGSVLYVVVEGKVRISRRLEGIGEEALAILGPGEVFGEMALVDDQPRSADALAHEGPCTVLSIDRDQLEAFITKNTNSGLGFLTQLCRLLCRRLRGMNEQLVAWRVLAGFG